MFVASESSIQGTTWLGLSLRWANTWTLSLTTDSAGLLICDKDLLTSVYSGLSARWMVTRLEYMAVAWYSSCFPDLIFYGSRDEVTGPVIIRTTLRLHFHLRYVWVVYIMARLGRRWTKRVLHFRSGHAESPFSHEIISFSRQWPQESS